MNQRPPIVRIDGSDLPGVPDSVLSEVTQSVREIEERTGYTAWYYIPSRRVQYHPGTTPRRAPVGDSIFPGGGYNPIDVEFTIKQIFASHESTARKEAQIRQMESDMETRREKALQDHAVDISGSLVGELLHIARKIENPHSRRVFAVS